MSQEQNQTNAEPFGLDDSGSPAVVPPTDNEKALSGLSYLSQCVLPAVMPFVLLLSEESKKSKFVRYHAVHSLALLVVAVAFELVATIVNMVIGAVIPCLLGILWVLWLLPAVPLVYYGIKAFQGDSPEIPWVTDFLKANNWL